MRQARELQNFKAKLRAKKRVTGAEKELRDILDIEQIPYKFQIIVGFYIVDFVILNRNLIIEVDGCYHNEPKQISYDRNRDMFLKRAGFYVERIPNSEVSNALEVINKYKPVFRWEKQFRHNFKPSQCH